MDSYYEQLVVKQRSGLDTAKVVLTLLASILLGGSVIYFSLLSGFIALVVLGMVIIGFGAWLAAGFGIEYEYILTNNELDIDKIIGKRKRKRLITVDLSKASAFQPVSNSDEPEAEVTVQASTGLDEDSYCVVCEHKDYGTVKVFFNPDQNLREAVIKEFPHALRKKVDNNG